MALSLRRPVGRLLVRAGYEIHKVDEDLWLLRRPGAKEPVIVERLDKTTWTVQRKRKDRRKIVPIGPPELRTHLLTQERRAPVPMSKRQRALGDYLAHELIATTLRELRVNCVLDVGANVGQYAQGLREAGYTGRIASFEPIADLAASLRDKASRDPDWLVFNCALGDEPGEAQINAVPGTMSSLLPSSEFGKDWSDKLQETHPETIRVERLDGILDEATAGLEDPRLYLKMDTQGYDLQTFRGAGKRIEDVLALQSEVACVPIYDGMTRMPEQLAAYEAEGFEITGIYPVSRHVSTLRMIELDLMMIRPDAMPKQS